MTMQMRQQLQSSHLVRLRVRVLLEQDLCLLLQNSSYCLTKVYFCRNCFCNIVRHFLSLSKQEVSVTVTQLPQRIML